MKQKIPISALNAAKKFGPGYFIREKMEERAWTQDDLAAVTGLSTKHINKILQDQQQLTLENARLFAEIFDTSAQYWVNLNTNYRLWLQQEKTPQEQDADTKSVIYERMPVKDLILKGWLPPYNSVKQLLQNVLMFWGWTTLDFTRLDEQYLPFLTRKSPAYNQFSASYAITWYRKALTVAAQRPRLQYDKVQLAALYDQMHQYSIAENGINQFIRALEAAGVIFFVLPHLQKTYLDGAAFFSDQNPVIVYTGRYKRVDNFWFTIAHEIAHVLLHLDAENPFFLDNLKDGEMNDLEKEANASAAEKLKHAEIFEFLAPYCNYLTAAKVEECVATYQVHPAIIVGKLAHEKAISYSNQNQYKEDALQLIESQYQF